MRVESDAHWRDSARSVRFFIWDGRLAFPVVLPLLYMRIWTWSVAIVFMFFFSILNRYGFTPMVFLRWLRCSVAGNRKLIKPSWER